MTKTIPITKAREELPSIIADANRKSERYEITVNGKPAAVLMSSDEYDAWEETNLILGDEEAMKALRIAEKEIAQGKGIPWEEVEKELDID